VYQRTLHTHEAGERSAVCQWGDGHDADIEAGIAVLGYRPGTVVDHGEGAVNEQAVGDVTCRTGGDESPREAQDLERLGACDGAVVVVANNVDDKRAAGATTEAVSAVGVEPTVGEVEVVDVVQEAEGIGCRVLRCQVHGGVVGGKNLGDKVVVGDQRGAL